jgi:ArsR family transcriptional regulator, arsenate/arsenite/antimonite-responsive transcriptional repressor
MQPILLFHQALADATRWRVLRQVWEQPLCVCELEEALRLPQSTLSSHLTILRKAGLLEVERQGKWAFYHIAAAMRPLLEHNRHWFQEELAKDKNFAVDAARIAKRVAMRGSTTCRSNARHRAIPPKPAAETAS